jgi:hypothetical protein
MIIGIASIPRANHLNGNNPAGQRDGLDAGPTLTDTSDSIPVGPSTLPPPWLDSLRATLALQSSPTEPLPVASNGIDPSHGIGPSNGIPSTGNGHSHQAILLNGNNPGHRDGPTLTAGSIPVDPSTSPVSSTWLESMRLALQAPATESQPQVDSSNGPSNVIPSNDHNQPNGHGHSPPPSPSEL